MMRRKSPRQRGVNHDSDSSESTTDRYKAFDAISPCDFSRRQFIWIGPEARRFTMATDPIRKYPLSRDGIITIMVGFVTTAIVIGFTGVTDKDYSDYLRAALYGLIAMGLYVFIKWCLKRMRLLCNQIVKWILNAIAKSAQDAIKNSHEMQKIAEIGYWRGLVEGRYSKELSFYTISDEGQEHNNLLNEIISAVNHVSNDAIKYQLFLIKYGGSTLRINSEYLKALLHFVDKGGEILIFVPRLYVEAFTKNPNQASRTAYDAIQALRSHCTATMSGNLSLRSYDEKEFGFFHTLKVGVLVKKDEFAVSGPDTSQYGFCFLSVKTLDRQHAVSSISHNPALVEFIAKGVKFFQKEKTQVHP